MEETSVYYWWLVDLFFVSDPILFSFKVLIFTAVGTVVEVSEKCEAVNIINLARWRPQR